VPHRHDTLQVAVCCYNNRGVCRKQTADPDRALEDFSAAIALNPKYTKAIHRRGKLLEDTNRFGEAIKDFRAAKGLDPANPEYDAGEQREAAASGSQ